MALKHVGRIASNRRKVVVAYRVVPDEPENCVVVQTENLSADEHDALIKAVESAAGQEAEEFAIAMARAYLPDGRNMLAGFHTTGKMRKVAQSEVEMTPNGNTVINLAELNKLIAEQKGVTVGDLAMRSNPAEAAPAPEGEVDAVAQYTETQSQVAEPAADGIITDEQLAAQYRSQADALFKEAKALREQAEELVPTKRKTKKTEESVQ
jgi:ABC-type amino acid transport substrate-binding protein